MQVNVTLEVTQSDINPVLGRIAQVLKEDSVSVPSICAVDECKAAFQALCDRAFTLGREYERNRKASIQKGT